MGEEQFYFPGVEKIVIVKRKARKDGNPQTGETRRIPVKKV